MDCSSFFAYRAIYRFPLIPSCKWCCGLCQDARNRGIIFIYIFFKGDLSRFVMRMKSRRVVFSTSKGYLRLFNSRMFPEKRTPCKESRRRPVHAGTVQPSSSKWQPYCAGSQAGKTPGSGLIAFGACIKENRSLRLIHRIEI